MTIISLFIFILLTYGIIQFTPRIDISYNELRHMVSGLMIMYLAVTISFFVYVHNSVNHHNRRGR